MSTIAAQNRPAKAGFVRAGAVFIALVVWAAGVRFTSQAVPIPPAAGGGPLAPLAAAFVMQLALSLAQYLVRSMGASAARWPYLVLILADVVINAIGILVDYQVVASPAAGLLFMLRSVATAAGLWQTAGALFMGLLIAALPEQLVRDAMKP